MIKFSMQDPTIRKVLYYFSIILIFCFWAIIVILEFLNQAQYIYYKEGNLINATSFWFLLNLLHIFIVLFWAILIVRMIRNKVARYIGIAIFSLVVPIFFQVYVFLLFYRLKNIYTFDFFYFWYNKKEAFLTVVRSFHPLAIAFFVSFFFLLLISWIFIFYVQSRHEAIN